MNLLLDSVCISMRSAEDDWSDTMPSSDSDWFESCNSASASVKFCCCGCCCCCCVDDDATEEPRELMPEDCDGDTEPSMSTLAPTPPAASPRITAGGGAVDDLFNGGADGEGDDDDDAGEGEDSDEDAVSRIKSEMGKSKS